MDRTSTKALLRKIFDAAVAAAHPASCLPPALPAAPAEGRIIMLAAGKAAGAMSEVAEAHYLRRRIPRERLLGIAVTRHGYGRPTSCVEMVEAGHPVPDAAGLAATQRVLALAQSAKENDLVLVLLSGGASANWIAPAPGVSLDDKQALTRALLASGADIREINTVRKHLSRIKGGRLAALAAWAQILTLAISDVPGDDPSVIGSGPTVPDPTTLADAEAILQRRKVEMTPSIAGALHEPANETPKPGANAFARAEFRIVARPADALAAAAEKARAEGLTPILLGDRIEGEAREVARDHAQEAIRRARKGERVLLLSGGELTVTLRGKGRGGPNQEYALALALALEGAAGIAAIAGDTDGTDGGSGRPDDPAGAFIDETTLSRARSFGLDPARFLAENNSSGFFERLGDLLAPGPTCTNVNDLRAILVDT
ncbi:MAG TPA: glycerate kinase [Xanthobacteraceae bacterium]|nr:glycerate kinase [Xanthobacteraceae bacterium]